MDTRQMDTRRVSRFMHMEILAYGMKCVTIRKLHYEKSIRKKIIGAS